MTRQTPASRTGRSLQAAALGIGLLYPTHSMCQTTAPMPPVAAEPAAKPSVTHAMEKGVTFKVGTALTWAVIGYVGTGSLVDAGVFSVFSTASSYTVYVVNDYVWDSLAPAPAVSPDNKSFDTSASLWRNTWKYLTFKPTINIINWGALYLYTGSLSATVAMGTTALIAVPFIFYANNMAWDWYDFRAAAAAGTK